MNDEETASIAKVQNTKQNRIQIQISLDQKIQHPFQITNEPVWNTYAQHIPSNLT